MDRSTLVERQQALEIEFNAKRQKTDQLRSQIEENERELLRVQGRFAEISEVIAKLPPEEDEELSKETQLKELEDGRRTTKK